MTLAAREASLELAVEDDGVAMAEPSEGKEPGLGSTLVERLARQEGGDLGITSEPGRGTRAVIRLKRGGAAPDPAVAVSA